MENIVNNKVLEEGLKKALIYGFIVFIFFIIGVVLCNMRVLIINFM